MPTFSTRTARSLILLVGMGAIEPVRAQRNEHHPSSAVEIAARLRSQGDVGRSVDVLRQVVTERQSAAARDSIADSLTAFVLTRSGLTDGLRATDAAVGALAIAGSPIGPGIPYAGAGRRLLTIAMEVPEVRGGAVYAIARLADSAESRALLESAAERAHPVAHSAVKMLYLYHGAEGLSLLRVLHQRGTVTESGARDQLARVAAEQAWPGTTRPTRPRDRSP
jgi:hypothetical protein